MIDGVRAELEFATERGRDAGLRFSVGPVELEFTVVVTNDLKAKGKVGLHVLTVGADATKSATGTHRITLTLNPHMPEGGNVEVSGRSQAIPNR